MDIDKVRALSDAELDQALVDAKAALWQARFALSTRQLKDYSSIPQTRRTIARILTVQRERKLEKTAWEGRDGNSNEDHPNQRSRQHRAADQAEDEGRPRRE